MCSSSKANHNKLNFFNLSSPVGLLANFSVLIENYFFSCIHAIYNGYSSRQQKKWWTWRHGVCPSARPAPPATPTGTILSVVVLCGPSAHWPALKVGNEWICDDKSRYHTILYLVLLFPDEENTTEHTPTHHMLQPPQAVFPACICAAVLQIVHLMEDGEVREDGVAGRLESVINSNQFLTLHLQV